MFENDHLRGYSLYKGFLFAWAPCLAMKWLMKKCYWKFIRHAIENSKNLLTTSFFFLSVSMYLFKEFRMQNTHTDSPRAKLRKKYDKKKWEEDNLPEVTSYQGLKNKQIKKNNLIFFETFSPLFTYQWWWINSIKQIIAGVNLVSCSLGNRFSKMTF